MREAGELRRPHALRVVRIVAFESPPAVDLVPVVEVVIDLEVGLLPHFCGAEAETIVGAVSGAHPFEPARIQAVADAKVVHLRHHAQNLIHIAGRIHPRAVGIPRGSRLHQGCDVGTIRVCGGQVCGQCAKHAHVVQ